MSVQFALPPHPEQTASAPRRHARTPRAVADVTAAIAARGLAARQIFRPDDSTAAPGSQYAPNDQALRSLSDPVAAEYRISPMATDRPNVASRLRLRTVRS